MKNRAHAIPLAAFLLSIFTGVAAGQSRNGFTGITVKIGDTVTVVAPDGAHLTGRVSEVETTFLTVEGQTIIPEGAVQIDRIGDPLWNGIRNGALFGFVFVKLTFPGALLMNAAIDRDCVVDSKPGCVVAMVAASAALGGVWDKLRVGRTTVFLNGVVQGTRLTVAPHVGAGHVSVRASIAWR